VKGATTDDIARVLGRSVSIHAPVKGATAGKTTLITFLWFQSTRP